MHRPEPLVVADLAVVDDDGRRAGFARLWGVFGTRARAQSLSSIPGLRRSLEQLLDSEDVVGSSADAREVRTLMDTLPRYDLFAASPPALRATVVELLAARRANVSIALLADLPDRPEAPSPQLLVNVAAGRSTPRLLDQVSEVVTRAVGSATADPAMTVSDGGQALLQFALAAPLAADRAEALLADVLAAVRTFEERLADRLQVRGVGDARRRANRFAERVTEEYVATVDADQAAADLAALENLGPAPAVAVAVDGRQLRAATAGDLVPLRIYRHGPPLELSAIVPPLESLGFNVVDEHALRIAPTVGPERAGHANDGGTVAPAASVVALRLRPAADTVLDAADPATVAEAATAMLLDGAEVDSLNRLVVAVGLSWRDVAVLRAYRQYRRQAGTPFSVALFNDRLVAAAPVAKALIDWFAARFDPAEAGGEQQARAAVEAHLETVTEYDADRILRDVVALIDATVRTNRYAEQPWAALALKLDSSQVPTADPGPGVEVFVASPTVRAIHLRGGAIARGGSATAPAARTCAPKCSVCCAPRWSRTRSSSRPAPKAGSSCADPPAARSPPARTSSPPTPRS